MLKPVQLGNSGLHVSQLCLGTMNFGVPGQGHQGSWTLDIDDSREIFRAAIDLGLFYFDCANFYGIGACEEVIGKLLREMLPRDEYVLTTKVAMPMGSNANMSGLSRKHIIEGMDRSLQRLGVDYVDQLIIHRHPHGMPWHVAVPIEETLGALNDLVKAGKVLCLGGTTKRSSGADMDRTLALYRGENDFKIAQRVVETAEKYGKTPAQIALAPDDIDYLKELYRPLDNLLSLGMS